MQTLAMRKTRDSSLYIRPASVCSAAVGIALEHVAVLKLDQRLHGALAVEPEPRWIVDLGEVLHRRFNRREHQRRIAGRAAGAGGFLAIHLAVDQHELFGLVREVDRER